MKINLFSTARQTIAIAGLLIIGGIFINANAQTQPKPFVRLVSSDGTNRYFETDLTQLPSFFEKAYFLETLFRDSVVVVQNSSLKNNSIPMLCNTKLQTVKVLSHIENLKAQAIKASENMSESEKAILVKKFEKFR